MHSIWVALQWEQRHEYDFLETITVAHSCPRLQLLTPKASKLHKSHSEESLISILFEALYFYLEIHSNPQIWSERLCRHRALIAGCMCPANMCHTHTRTCMTHIHTPQLLFIQLRDRGLWCQGSVQLLEGRRNQWSARGAAGNSLVYPYSLLTPPK